MFDLKEIVIAFVVVGILLGFGALILQEVQEETLTCENSETENITTLNGSAVALTSATDICDWSSFVCNATTLTLNTDYVYSADTPGSVTLYNNTFNATSCNATYTADTHSIAYNSTGEAIDAVGDISGWLPLLGLVIIAAIIIGYLLYSFGSKVKTGI